MKRTILLAMMVSLFAVGAYAQKAPKRQGTTECLNLETLYGDVESVTVSQLSRESDSSSKFTVWLEQTHKFNKRGDLLEMQPTMLDFAKIQHSYNSQGQLIKTTFSNLTTNEAWWIKTYSYDANGNEIKCLQYSGSGKSVDFKTYTKYYAKNKPASIISYDAYGGICYKKLFYYDKYGRLIKEKEEKEVEITISRYKYDSKGRVIEYDDCNPDNTIISKTLYTYDAKGNKIEEKRCGVDGTLYEKSTYKYNANNKIIEKIEYDRDDQPERKSVYKYDSIGNIIEIEIYDKDGTPSSKYKHQIVYRK